MGVIVVGWRLTTLQFGLGAWPTAGIVPLHAIGRLLTELADTVSWFVGATAVLVGTAATLYEIPVDARARGHRDGNRHAR